MRVARERRNRTGSSREKKEQKGRAAVSMHEVMSTGDDDDLSGMSFER
jgi:hypothetical protein